MIDISKTTLSNGLRVIANRDETAKSVAFTMLYNVGSKDENANLTGLAHLFEHLMFSGTKSAPSFDKIVEEAGGHSNAFTTNDFTCYYITLPKQNIETAFWLEADRLKSLIINEKRIDIQKKVIKEEYYQRYVNQPYGDIWGLIRPLAYTIHPYKWPTIGSDIMHVMNADTEDILCFFKKHYSPSNAILSVAGDIIPEEIFRLAEKWFSSITCTPPYIRQLPSEPLQKSERLLTVLRPVPHHAIYMAFHCAGRGTPDYYPTELLADILSGTESSLLHQELVKSKQIFTELDSFVTGDIDTGLMVIAGKLKDGIPIEDAASILKNTISKNVTSGMIPTNLEMVKNKAETAIAYQETKILEKAINLAYFENIGDAEGANLELENYEIVSPEEIQQKANQILNLDAANLIYYQKEGQ